MYAIGIIVALVALPMFAQTAKNEDSPKTYGIDYMPINSNDKKIEEELEEKEHQQYEAKQASLATTSGSQLVYQGGSVEVTPRTYVIFWGSQWSSDPAGEANYLKSFLGGLYGTQDNWSTVASQYCQGAAIGSLTCSGPAQSVVHPNTSPLGGYWSDSATAAPSSPSQIDLQNEAIKAAAHFGNTTAAANKNVQYVVATSHNNNQAGFGTQWCAWHSAVDSGYGTIAYTNLPYIPDVTWQCGANQVNAGTAGNLDGVSIVAGHEYVESITDPFPNTGWVDNSTAEIADKCAWQYERNLPLATGTFAVQGLWSNIVSSTGACVNSYTLPTPPSTTTTQATTTTIATTTTTKAPTTTSSTRRRRFFR
jgi:hypothetical protein